MLDLLCRKSVTDATATQSSQNSIVKKMIDAIAATPAANPNQLIQRGRIAKRRIAIAVAKISAAIAAPPVVTRRYEASFAAWMTPL